MVENGYKKITLSPALFGLEYAKIKAPTPYGYIKASLNKDGKNEFDIPEEIEYKII